MLIFLSIGLAAVDPILVIGSRAPIELGDVVAPLSTINAPEIEALGVPQVVDTLRLAPGVSIARAGATGNQTQVRLRGSEANHILVFIDGIEAVDPASSNEFRWETLSTAGVERVLVLRGPQSALWGAAAIGGVVSVTTLEPLPGERLLSAELEYGSFDTRRAAASGAFGTEAAGASFGGSLYETDGIDTFAGGPVERDGFENANLHAKLIVRPGGSGELGLSGWYSASRSAFDGFDPATFRRADTREATDAEQFALRAFGRVATLDGGWTHHLEGSWLQSDNRNSRADTPLNRTEGSRLHTAYQSELAFGGGGFDHLLVAAAEFENESFDSSDNEFFGFTDQSRERTTRSLIGEYRLAGGGISAAASVRYDDNEGFADAVTWRAAASAALGSGWEAFASAGRGFAAPTFTEQFGFFPGSFIGNPDLKPETSIGYEAGVRWEREGSAFEIAGFRSDLEDEILTVFDSASFLSSVDNAAGKSRRQGIELAGETSLAPWLRARASYTFLDAEEPAATGGDKVREVRRARHSATAAMFAEWQSARLSLLASYVGPRRDIDFETFPAADVRLDDYVLVNLAGAYEVVEGIEITGRVQNLLGADYQDVFGYSTEGLAAFAGLRLTWVGGAQ